MLVTYLLADCDITCPLCISTFMCDTTLATYLLIDHNITCPLHNKAVLMQFIACVGGEAIKTGSYIRWNVTNINSIYCIDFQLKCFKLFDDNKLNSHRIHVNFCCTQQIVHSIYDKKPHHIKIG